jgi:alkyl hydroperoxide reductase subunit AhpC
MALQLGDIAPDFEADSAEGKIKFHDYIGDGRAVFFSHHLPSSGRLARRLERFCV